ncbi:hypothetical protein MNV49_001606 [Pseudohyphozyma bogoriensis]|nr:hypothetical protein MNV49_001606 [Pseudohyphozyma bogoriensis]
MFHQARFSHSPIVLSQSSSPEPHLFLRHPQSPPQPTSYEAYDAHRSALEAQALARKQQLRRSAERSIILERQQALILRQQHYEAALEAVRQRQVEVARRQQEEARRQAAYEAAVRAEVERRREAYAVQLEYQRNLELRRRARLQAVQEQRRRALAAEQRRYVAAAEDEDVFDLGAFVQHILKSAFKDISVSTTLTSPAPASSPAPSKPTAATPSPAPQAADETPVHRFDISTQIPDPFVSPPTFNSNATSAPADSASTPSTSPATPRPPSPAEESAATTLQRRFRNHLFRKQQLSTISSLTSTFDSHTSAFTLPTSLAFVSTTSPKLAYSANNTPFHAHEDFLVALLSQIDEVASKGDKVVKSARKELVKKVEEELRRVDEWREEEFGRFRAAVRETEMVEDEAEAEAEGEEKVEAELTQEVDEGEPVSSFALSNSGTDVAFSASTVDDEELPPLLESATHHNATSSSPNPVDEAVPSPADAFIGSSDSSAKADVPAAESTPVPAQPEEIDTTTRPLSVGTTITPLRSDSLAALPSNNFTPATPSHHSDSTESRTISTLDEEEDGVPAAERAGLAVGVEVEEVEAVGVADEGVEHGVESEEDTLSPVELDELHSEDEEHSEEEFVVL